VGWNSGASGTYTTWRQHSTCADFYNSTFTSDFEAYISHLLNHVNPLTGLAWKDDPTILAWEEENEGTGDSTWSETIAAYIKGIDSNHLVSWGSNDGGGTPTSSDLSAADIDMYDGHFYSDFGGSLSTFESAASAAVSAGKVYYLGEMGWNDATSTNLSAILSDTDFAGDLPWDIEPLADSYGYVAKATPTAATTCSSTIPVTRRLIARFSMATGRMRTPCKACPHPRIKRSAVPSSRT